MSNIRSMKRNIARHPVNVWRAKQKAKQQAEEAAKAKETAFPLTEAKIEEIKAALPQP